MSYNALNDRLEEFSGKLYCFLTINEVIEQEKPYSHTRKTVPETQNNLFNFSCNIDFGRNPKDIVFTLAGFEVACYYIIMSVMQYTYSINAIMAQILGKFSNYKENFLKHSDRKIAH